MDFDYKKYSLENLEKWMSDALLSSEATPQEIYDVIHKVVEEEYHYFKHHTGRCYDLMALLNGNGKGHLTCDKDDQSEECKNAWTSFWEEYYYPEEYKGSTVSSVQYTEEELNAMCDKAASDQEKDKCREYNLREAEYYDKRAQLDARTYSDRFKTQNGVSYNEYAKAKIEANSAWNDGWTQKYYQDIVDKYEGKKDEVKKWILPVEEVKDEDTDENVYCVSFPDDLLTAADLKEGDQVEWVDKGDGSYLLRKVTKPIGMEEC